jgi:DMSO/TMAO reductase YedYZ molybdopterin-dependent catalytic subunit
VDTTSSDLPVWLWKLAREKRMTRRTFLRLLGAGGVSAVLMACSIVEAPNSTKQTAVTDSDGTTAATPSQSPVFKNPLPFINHGEKGLESRLELMQGFVTPNRLFFVRNNSSSVDIDAKTWELSVEGDGVATPRSFTYDELRSLPTRSVVSYLECAGNQRAMFDRVKGQEAQGTQWGTGALGNGVWTGVSLRDVLELAGAKGDAAHVLLIGLDRDSPESGWRRALPIVKALDPDTLLAYTLNGEDLPRDHGYPLRALVPGWVGSASVKWLGRIVVSTNAFWTRNNTTSYVLIGDAYPPEGEALGKVLSTQVIKSALALPWPAELPTGLHRLHGYAHSPFGRIEQVEWSIDSGGSWQLAQVLEPQVQYSWARFEILWEAQAGKHTLMTRATDSAGNAQPAEIPFNEKGYLFNQPLPHPITVT